MAMTNKMRRIVAQSRTPYMYLSDPRVGGMCVIKFLKNKGKTGSPTRQHWFFNTPFVLTAEHWDKSQRCVAATHPEAAHINEQLAHLHDIAMMAIEEGNTQDQLRHLIDSKPTIVHGAHAPSTKNRPSAAPEETAQAPLFEERNVAAEPLGLATRPRTPHESFLPEPGTVARAVEHINTLFPQPAEPATDQREFVVNGEAFTLETRAVRAAWDASKASGLPVEVFERQLVVIGRINANCNA